MLIFAFFFFFSLSFTQFGPAHPDEWMQTVEFGHWLAFGNLSQTTDFFLHLRNLTWPSVIAGIFTLSQWIFPNSVAARFLGIKLTLGFLSWLSWLGWCRWIKHWTSRQEQFDSEEKKQILRFASLLFLLLPIQITEATRPSQEHLSALALGLLAWTLTLSAKKGLFWQGFAAVSTGIARYPSGLLGAGALAVRAVQILTRSPARMFSLVLLTLGAAVAVLAGGLADRIFYGRLGESLWMYLQFNVWTGLSWFQFNSQPATVYLDFFAQAFRHGMIPLGVCGLFFTLKGLFRGLRSFDPLTLGGLLTLIAHCLISHKESRFMAPLVPWILWLAVQGRIDRLWFGLATRWYKGVRALIFIPALVMSLSAWRGDFGRGWEHYLLGIGHAEPSTTCAVISILKAPRFLQPGDPKHPEARAPAWAYFPAPRRTLSSHWIDKRPLIWIDQAPQCKLGQTVMVLLDQQDPWIESHTNCVSMNIGLSRWSGAPWYRCPLDVLSLWPHQEIRSTTAMKKHAVTFQSLPPYGITGEQLLRHESLATPHALRDGTLGDW